MNNQNEHAEALFEQLSETKQKRQRSKQEILSGLTEGRTYYYESYDTLELSPRSERKQKTPMCHSHRCFALSSWITTSSGRLFTRSGHRLLPSPRLSTICVLPSAYSPASYLGKNP